MKYLFSLLLIGSTLLPFVAKADIAPDPGTHEYSTHAEFDNLADYPAYDVYVSDYWRFGPSPVLATPATTPTVQQIQSNGHPDSTLPPFFAVKKSNQALIVHKDDPGQEQGDIWGSLPENKQYMINAAVTGTGASLEKELVSGGNLPDSNPVVYIVWVYHIDSLTDTAFTAHFVSESRYDANAKLVSGSALPKANTTATTAQPTVVANSAEVTPISAITSAPATSFASSMGLLWIVIVCIGAVILALAVKTWKK